MRNGKPPTLSDVARDAGVSPFTVSVVLNGSRSNTRVSDATRERILVSARALRYQANASARNLARQRTGTVGVLFGIIGSAAALANDYASAILEGIVQTAAEREVDVMLHTSSWRDAARSAGRFSDRRTDGVVLVAPPTDSDLLEGMAGISFLPLVAISASPERCGPLGIATADVDSAAGISLAVAHLAGLGHRRIAHLMGNANVYSVEVRRAAFLGSMATRGLEVPPEYLVETRYDASSVPDALPALLALRNPPTAIVAGNDKIALAALQAARDKGLTVPKDLSIVGFDDIAAAHLVTPGLTTVHQPTAALGAAALELLLDRIAAVSAGSESALPPPQLLVPPRLVVRGSTAPPS